MKSQTNPLYLKILSYLEKHRERGDHWVDETLISQHAIKNGFKHSDIITALAMLRETAHIGHQKEKPDWVVRYRSYPQNDLTRFTQTCLDRGSDW